MWLADVWIHGLRRFGGDRPHRVRIDAKLVCLIGANEAGKSTILEALELSQQGGPIAPARRTRRELVPDEREIIRLRYRLQPEDVDAVAARVSHSAVRDIRWFDLMRTAGGDVQFVLEPALSRDLRPRRSAQRALAAAADSWWPAASEGEEPDPSSEPVGREIGLRVRDALNTYTEDLPGSLLSDLRTLADEIDREDDDLASELRQLADWESTPDPGETAVAVLRKRVPDFVRFDDDARLLGSEYELGAAVDSPEPALSNLAALAKLNLRELYDAITRGETGTVRDIREAANQELRTRFSAWREPPDRRGFVGDGRHAPTDPRAIGKRPNNGASRAKRGSTAVRGAGSP